MRPAGDETSNYYGSGNADEDHEEKARGRRTLCTQARGGGPKSVHQLARWIQHGSRWLQTEKTTDLSSSREVDSRNIIRIIFGEIYKKLDLPPIDRRCNT